MGRLLPAIVVAFLFLGPTLASAQVATPVYPPNGSQTVDLAQPITWTPVEGVNVYYVYIGRTPGGKELRDSGEITTTSLPRGLAGIPTGEMVFLRLWTQVAGVWRYTDTTFGALTAYAVNPTTMSLGTQRIEWTPVANTQAYYIYLGTTPGSTNIVNSGELKGLYLQFPQYPIAILPSGPTYYLRIWTKLGGIWRYTDSTLNASKVAYITSPTTYYSGNFDAFQWTTVIGAQVYYLYVGTSAGASDVVNSGELQTTTIAAKNLPRGQLLYLRLWTKSGGVWRFIDSQFVLATAQLTYPLNGSATFAPSSPVQWTSVPNAQTFTLWVGTTPGTYDVYRGSETLDTSAYVNVPMGQTLHVRLWTKYAGAWRYSDSTFSWLTATLIWPLANFTVNAGQGISWNSIPGALAYYVYIGTAPGTSNLLNTGELHETLYGVQINISGPRILYLRLWTKMSSGWRYIDQTYFVP